MTNDMRKRLVAELHADRRAYPWALVVLAMIYIINSPVAERFYDRHVMPSQWVAAEIAITQATAEEAPLISYQRRSLRDVQGTWTVAAYDRAGTRLFTQSGSGDYWEQGRQSLWAWSAFLVGGRPAPPVPSTPFKMCVSYRLTPPSGVESRSGPFCSNWSDEPIPLSEINGVIE